MPWLKKLLLFVLGAGLSSGVDQLTKHWILEWTARIPRGMVEPIIPGILEINFAQNIGAAFSIFTGFPITFFQIMGLLAMVFIVGFLWRLEQHQTDMVVALSLVMGGALGNQIDRVRHDNHVTDFLYLHYHDKFSWPVFNAADLFIVIGVVILVLRLTQAELQRMAEVRRKRAAGAGPGTDDAPAD